MSRSRRGWAAAAIYALITLLPLALDLVMRCSFVTTWPLAGTGVADCLSGNPVILMVLVLALNYDLLIRGDRQGWQEGGAALPVDEFTWLLGRLSGRSLWLLMMFLVPWIVGWIGAGLWAGRPLDLVPLASGFLRWALLPAAMALPLVVLAGCVGNSLLAAGSFLFVGLGGLNLSLGWLATQVSLADFDLFRLATGDSSTSFSSANFHRLTEYLTADYYRRQEYVPGQLISTLASPDRGWPPWGEGGPELLMLALLMAHWGLFLATGPLLVRLQRRPGWWRPTVPSLPTFATWLANTLDQIRPVWPNRRLARLLCLAGVALLAASGARFVLVLGAAWAREAPVVANRVAGLRTRQWPTLFILRQRDLDLEIASNGQLRGRELLLGRVEGNPDKPVPFALAPGMEMLEVSDGEGKQLAWLRETELVWVSFASTGVARVEFSFAGRPCGINPVQSKLPKQPGFWRIFEPLRQTPGESGQSRWSVDLEDLSWAPEPVYSPAIFGDHETRLPCCGPTKLRVSLPPRLVPVPLPGRWQEESGEFRWEGRSLALPPVVAGRYQRDQRPGVKAVAAAAGADLPGLLDIWTELSHQLPPLACSGEIVLRSVDFTTGFWQIPDNYDWGFRFWLPELTPGFEQPAGMVILARQMVELRPLRVTPASVRSYLHGILRLSRARFRYEVLLPRLTASPEGVRRLVWWFAVAIETWPWSKRFMVLGLEYQFAFEAVDLTDCSGDQPSDLYMRKLKIVVAAVTTALGTERIASGLSELAAGDGPLTLDELWRALAGARQAELAWLGREVLMGSQIATPELRKVSVTEAMGGFEVQVTLVNKGRAFTRVPVSIVTPGGRHDFAADIEPEGQGMVSATLPLAPTAVLLDPDHQVVRARVLATSWTPAGGIM